MANFTCQPGRTSGYPDIWSDVILDVTMRDWTLRSVDLSMANWSLLYKWPSSNQLKAWEWGRHVAQKVKQLLGESTSHSCLCGSVWAALHFQFYFLLMHWEAVCDSASTRSFWHPWREPLVSVFSLVQAQLVPEFGDWTSLMEIFFLHPGVLSPTLPSSASLRINLPFK